MAAYAPTLELIVARLAETALGYKSVTYHTAFGDVTIELGKEKKTEEPKAVPSWITWKGQKYARGEWSRLALHDVLIGENDLKDAYLQGAYDMLNYKPKVK